LSRILVVEDDDASREVLVTRLTARGYEVSQAVSGEEALQAVRRTPPDLVLLDVGLPGMDGLQVSRELKSDSSLPFIPIILVTGRSETRDVVAGLEAGGDEYLTKPVEPAALPARVQSMLRIKSLHDTVEQQRRDLERFVSPQVAELIGTSGSESMLQSHRGEIAILRVRLAGFAAFSEVAAPEEVLVVLQEFHAAMGELIEQFNATFERFTGDGVQVFFNDPLPCPDPAACAVRLGLAMRDRAHMLSGEWRERGHNLDFSAAVTMGYATLGVIGFAGRSEYAAVGLVSDQAVWLCDSASADQVLVTQRVMGAVRDLVNAEDAGALRFPDSAREVHVFRVLGEKTPVGRGAAERFAPLSPREYEVARLVSEGLTNRQIAERLVFTEATAAKHIENILNKLSFNSRTQIATWHSRTGEIRPESS
jgi:adenylate cyclase